MMQLIAGGLMGLTLGAWLHLSRLCIRKSTCRHLLLALGLCVMLAALLIWLAVIDVDLLTILPLHAGVLLGGALYGVTAALTGLTPLTALAGLGCGRFLESLCGVAGLAAGLLLLPVVEPVFLRLHNALPLGAQTLFALPLKPPPLLSGGTLALLCLGFLIWALGLCFRQPKAAATPEPAPEPIAEAEDAVVAVLPEEEPVVVDAAQTDPDEKNEEAPEEE